MPDRFLGITNGITTRRWLALSNPGLTSLIREAIGDGFLSDWTRLQELEPFAEAETIPEDSAERALLACEYL